MVAAAHHKSILVSPRRALQAEKFGLSVGGALPADDTPSTRVNPKIRGNANLAGAWSAQPVPASPPRAAHSQWGDRRTTGMTEVVSRMNTDYAVFAKRRPYTHPNRYKYLPLCPLPPLDPTSAKTARAGAVGSFACRPSSAPETCCSCSSCSSTPPPPLRCCGCCHSSAQLDDRERAALARFRRSAPR